MNLELLPNEILLDLFEYLNGVDIFHGFYGLNSRFNLLLYKQFQIYSFQFDSISKYKFDIICQQHLPLIANRVIDLSLSDDDDTPEQINLFLSYIPSFSQFIHLRSLSLSQLHSDQTLIKIIDACQQFCNFTRLKFSTRRFQINQIDFQLIVNSIWNLPKLTHCKFCIYFKERQIFCKPTKTSSTLECLNIYGSELKWNEINQLLAHTPRLKHLSIFIITTNDDNCIASPLSTLINLRISNFGMRDTWKMISFLQKISNLQHLEIRFMNNIIDGHQWEQIIRNYLPKLKVFHFGMRDKRSADENIQELVDQLIDSFRSSFWIDEHKWFVRCITWNTVIYLQTLFNKFRYDENNFPNSFKSTYPNDDHQEYYNNRTNVTDEALFNPSISSNIRLSNIRHLWITLPINDQFWSFVPSLDQLHSLTVSSYIDTYQSEFQALLNRTPHLHILTVKQDALLPLQVSLFKCTNTSIRGLYFEKLNYQFNEEECMTLMRSSLGVQCEVLSIKVKNRESIIILVKNMINLRALYVQCEDENTSNKDELIQWLIDHLSSICVIIRDTDSFDRIRIWK